MTSASIWRTFRAYSKFTKSQVITAFEDKEAKATSRQKRNEYYGSSPQKK
jgi:hypothetical protein